METMHVERIEPPFECSPPNSLRRRRRQVLRTPSVERDFASIARLDINLMDDSHEPFESVTSHSSCETSSTTTHNSHSTVSAIADTPLSPISRTTSQSSDSSDSSDSDHSDTSPSDLVITPLTSVSDVHEDREVHPQKEVIHAFDPHERPDSWCSFSTAKSDFCDI
ncbi:hypothetical protein BDQ17DRAFT_1344907 [Cyathus striatus]|nr:hypothetical protein BDQ17DRAFT_1344907 [Cyathus striatus]